MPARPRAAVALPPQARLRRQSLSHQFPAPDRAGRARLRQPRRGARRDRPRVYSRQHAGGGGRGRRLCHPRRQSRDILAAGFAEVGAEGRSRQQRLVEIAGEAGLRLVGPNSLGVVNTRTALTLTANASFAADELPKGRLTVISQSGSLLGTFISRGGARGIGFAKMISVGNEADLSVGEIGAALAEDADTDAFLCSWRRCGGRTRSRASRRWRVARASRSSPTSSAAPRRVRSWRSPTTGAMIGSDAAAEAFLRHHGILRVDHLETLLEVAPLMIGRAPPAAGQPGASASSPRPAAAPPWWWTASACSASTWPRPARRPRNGSRPPASPPSPAASSTSRWRARATTSLRAALETLLAAPKFALVVAVVGSSAQFNPELAVKPIIDCAGHATPIAVFLTPHADQTLRLLAEHGVAAFRHAGGLRRRHCRLSQVEPPVAATSVDERALAGRARGAGCRARRGCWTSSNLARSSRRWGIPAARVSALELDGALRAPLPFPFPVAAKVLSADIAHKTDAGGVALGIASPEELATGVAALVAAVRERRP